MFRNSFQRQYPPRMPMCKPSSDPFYALASASPPWTYMCDTGYNWVATCVGIWPLEALCLALLLDEGMRSDVALAVFFARCLKTNGHLRDADVYTRRELILEEASQYNNRGAINLDPKELDRLTSELPVCFRYSCVLTRTTADGSAGSSFEWQECLDTTLGMIERGELPPKEAIDFHIHQRGAGPLLLSAAASADSLDVAMMVFSIVVDEVHEETELVHGLPRHLASALTQHGMKWFSKLADIMLQSACLRSFVRHGAVTWEMLWDCKTPADAAFVAKTLQHTPADMGGPPLTQYRLHRSEMAVVYAVYEVHGLLDEINFVQKLPTLGLDTDAIEFLREGGHLDKILSSASEWMPYFLQKDVCYFGMDVLRYLKGVGASFEGAGNFFGMNLIPSEVFLRDRLFDCWKFCVDNDPILPGRFSPSATMIHVLRSRAQFDEESLKFLHAAVEFIHQLAVQHNLLGPDPTTGDSLLTAIIRSIGRTIVPSVHEAAMPQSM